MIIAMREVTVERHLRKQIVKLGGLCMKFVSPGYRGVPDRIVLLDGGELIFVELKAPNKKLKEHQERMHKILHGLGFSVVTIDSLETVDGFVKLLRDAS